MPWKERTAMSQRLEFVQEALRENANLRALCRAYGISPRTGYKWLKRYRAEREAGLYERSRRPQHSPHQSSGETEEAVLRVRQAHPSWGGRKIQWQLEQDGIRSPAPSTITAILRRKDQIEPEESPKHRAVQRFAMEEPNQLWQMDFKGHFEMMNGGTCHPLTVLDDASRFLVGLQACAAERSKGVKLHLERIFEQYGLPERMLMDNGSVWRGYHTQVSVWLIRWGIQIVHGRPYHPQTQGKDERLHRTLKQELLSQLQFLDLPDCQAHFDPWRNSYNCHRPHEALQMQTPASHYQPSARPFPGTFPEIHYEPNDILRKTDHAGRVHFHHHTVRVGKAFANALVALRPTQVDGVFQVFFFKQRLTQFSLRKDQA